MPLLDEIQQNALGPTILKCLRCPNYLIRNYCRTCDEYFFECPGDGHSGSSHLEHRTYAPPGSRARQKMDLGLLQDKTMEQATRSHELKIAQKKVEAEEQLPYSRDI